MFNTTTETDDVLFIKEEPIDQVEDLLGPSYFIVLRNFGLNSAALKSEHYKVIRDWVLYYSKNGAGFVETYAQTDRSGTKEVNYKVSEKRLAAVLAYMIQIGCPINKVRHAFAKAIGEDYLEYLYQRDEKNPFLKDDKKRGDMRCVAIALTPAPTGFPSRRFRTSFVSNFVAFCRMYQRPRL